MDVREAKRLKGLEDENARLKRLQADAMLDNAALKDFLGNKWRRPLRSNKRSPIWWHVTRCANGERAV